MKNTGENLRLVDAIRVKSAEMWLDLGEPVPALLELQKLPARALRDPWANQVRLKAFHAVHCPAQAGS